MQLKNITLKGVTKFRGHEGEPLHQGNIYLNNKKVGNFSEDSWGGGIIYDFDSKEMKSEVEKIAKSFYEENENGLEMYGRPPIPITCKEFFKDNEIEGLITELLELWDAEQEYKGYFKKGYPIMFVMKERKKGYTYSLACMPSRKETIESNSETGLGDLVVKVYESLEDFIFD